MLRLLDIAGRPDVPVAPGASDPLLTGPTPARSRSCTATTVRATSTCRRRRAHPLDVSAARVHRRPGDARDPARSRSCRSARSPTSRSCCGSNPRSHHHVREVVLMGGNALGPGNATPAAEANIRNDPEAADPRARRRLARHDGRASTSRTRCSWTTPTSPSTRRSTIRPRSDIAVDRAVLPRLLRRAGRHRGHLRTRLVGDRVRASPPSCSATERWPIRVDCTQGISRGKTWPALGDTDEHRLAAWHDRPLVNVCVGVDGPAVVALELATMRA